MINNIRKTIDVDQSYLLKIDKEERETQFKTSHMDRAIEDLTFCFLFESIFLCIVMEIIESVIHH